MCVCVCIPLVHMNLDVLVSVTATSVKTPLCRTPTDRPTCLTCPCFQLLHVISSIAFSQLATSYAKTHMFRYFGL